MKKFLGTIACLSFLISSAQSQTITNFSPVAYTEKDGWKYMDQTVTVTYGSNWDGGFIEFDVTNVNDDGDEFRLTNGTLFTLSGGKLLNGSNEVIGFIDPIFNGTSGKKLRVHFASAFTNGSFEDGINGWTILAKQIDLGTDSIAGWPTVESDPYPSNTTNKDNNVFDSTRTFYFRHSLSTSEFTDGTQSLRLESRLRTKEECDVVHGPAAYSDTFQAIANEVLYFDWRAVNGRDDYDAFGYILNVNNGTIYEVFNSNGGETSWATVSFTVPATSTYRFVFVNGTHDLTCGNAAGASLYIDNIRVFGNKVSSAMVEDIIEHTQFRNDCGTNKSNRTIEISAKSGSGDSVNVSGTSTFTTYAPVAFAKNITVALDTNGNVTVDPLAADSASFDTCGIASRSLSKSTFNCNDIGANTVTFVVKDSYGDSATQSIIITVQDTFVPRILIEPEDSTTCPGTGASYTVTAAAYGCNFNYLWQINTGSGWSNVSGFPYSGATSSTLVISTTDTLMDFHEFRCIVGTSTAYDTTRTVTHRVFRKPLITLEPIQPESKCGGDSVKLYVGSYGTDLNYEWQRDNGNGWFTISGAVQPFYNTGQLTTLDNGAKLRCILSGKCSPPDTSEVMTLIVRGDRPIVTVISKTPPSPGQSNGSIDVDVSNYNQFILNSRWTYKDDVHFENTNSGFDLTNAKAADYYLMLITREYCIYYDGPHPLR